MPKDELLSLFDRYELANKLSARIIRKGPFTIDGNYINAGAGVTTTSCTNVTATCDPETNQDDSDQDPVYDDDAPETA